MTILFEVIDPRGFMVVCTEDRWRFHILEQHPHVQEDDVKRAIEKPSFGIYSDADYDDRQIYYLFRIGKRYVTYIHQGKKGVLRN